MSYQQEKKRQEQFSDAVETATNAANEIKVFMARHAEVKDLLANYSVIYSYFHNDLESIDEASLEDSWNNHPKFREMLALWPSEDEEKQTLSDKIIELLRPGTSPTTLLAEKAKHKYMSVVALRITAQELQERSDLHKKSTAELREIIRRPQPGFQELPPLYRNRSMLLTLGPTELRHFIKIYGSDNINRVLNQREK